MVPSDLQGIVIVGDIKRRRNGSQVERGIQRRKSSGKPCRTYLLSGSRQSGTVDLYRTDKEVANPSINIFFKQDATPDSLKNTISYYATQYVLNMAINMLNSRLNELRQTANPPFTGAGAGYGEYFLAKTKEAFSLTANSKIDGVDLAMKTILGRRQNVHVFGFTET